MAVEVLADQPADPILSVRQHKNRDRYHELILIEFFHLNLIRALHICSHTIKNQTLEVRSCALCFETEAAILTAISRL